jgi:hypothetical protein
MLGAPHWILRDVPMGDITAGMDRRLRSPDHFALRASAMGCPQSVDTIPADYRHAFSLIAASIFALTALRLKDAGACIGGKSMAVSPSSATTC